MATRYWVGGSGTWTASDTTHWSASSGGPAGASAPTADDDVIFDSASSATSYTVTIGADAVVTGYNTGAQLVVTAVTSGTVAVGQTVGFDVTTFTPSGGGTITSLGTGSGGVGSYNLSVAVGTSATTFYLNYAQCRDITVAGPASGSVQFAGSTTTGFLCIAGSMTLPATGMSSTYSSPLIFTATTTGKTITTNGVSLVNLIYLSGAGGGWTLGSALTSTLSIYVQAGTFDTGGYNLTLASLLQSSSSAKTINLNASTLNLSGNGSITFSGTGLTFNAGTSTINLSATGPTFAGGGNTFYNVDFTGGAGTKTISGVNTFNNLSFSNTANTVVTFSNNQTVNGNTTFAGNSQTLTLLSSTFANTTTFSSSTGGSHTITTTGGSFNNLTFTSLSGTGRYAVVLNSNITVNGTLTIGAANTAIRRFQISSSTVGTRRTITLNGTLATLADVDFRDIGTAGTAGTWTGTRIGNALNNTGITFTAGATKYWNLAAGGNWSATAWALSSGGAVSVDNFPLVQDNIVIENTGLNTSATITIDALWWIPTINFSTRTNAMTWASGTQSPIFYGNITLSTSVTISGTGTFAFSGQGLTQNITSAGRTFTQIFTVNAPGGTFKLLDAFNTSNATAFTLTAGTLDCNTFNFTAAGISSSNSNTRSVLLSSGTITLSGATPIDFSTSTNLTLTAGTSTLTCSNASPTLNGGGLTFYNVSQTSTAANNFTITGVNTFNNLTLTTPTTTAGLRTLTLGANQTINGTLTLGATNSGNKRIQVVSSVTGTQRTLTVATIATLSDVNFKDIVAAGASGTWSGTRLGNAGNNSNITFGAGVDKYWNLAAGGNLTDTAWALTSGGAVSNDNFPLPQDNIIFENTGLNTSATVTWNSSGGYWGTINCSTRTNAMTLALGTNILFITKDFTLSTAVTLTGTGTFNWVGNGNTQNITTAGISIPQNNSISNPGGTVKLIDNFTTTQANFTLGLGTLDLNDKTLTCVVFSSSATTTRTIAFGTSGKIVVTGNNATVFTTSAATNLTITGTSYVELNYAGSTGTRTITCSDTAGARLNVYVTAGTDIVTTGGTTVFQSLDFTGFSGTFSNVARNFYGNLTFSSTMTISAGTGLQSFGNTSGTAVIKTNGQTLDFPITQNGAGGTVQLFDDLTMGLARSYTLTAGTLDLNTNKVLSTGLFSSSGSTTRAISFGTSGKIVVTGNNTTVWNLGTATNFTYTGTSRVECTYSGSVGTRGITQGAGSTESNAVNIYVTAGTDIISGTLNVKTFDLTGFTGTVADSSRSVYGNLLLTAGTTWNSSAVGFNFSATSGTQQITTNGVVIEQGIGVQSTVQLQDNLTLGSTRLFALNSGTLDLNNQTLSTGLFSSSNSNTRAIAFGTGNITVTGNNAIVWTTNTATNLSMSGSKNIDCTYSGATGTRTISLGAISVGAIETNVPNINITAGTDIIEFGTNKGVLSLSFNGFSGTYSPSTLRVFGNLIFSLGMTISATVDATTFGATSGTQTITTNGQTLDFPITQNGVGGTVSLADALTLGATRTLSFINGTFTTNNYNVTAGRYALNAGTRTINMGSSTFLAQGTSDTTASWNVTDATNLTINAGTSTIQLNEAYTGLSSQNFVGGGKTYYNLLISGGEDVTIYDSNTFNNITNTVTPLNLKFDVGTTNNFVNWNVVGLPSNNVVINSSDGATSFTLNYTGSGFVSTNYLTISNSTATPSSTWYAGANSTDSGNNSGWLFAYAPVRYWVGGSGNWDATTTTNWSVTSGGTAGVTAPSSTDSVIFDANSNVGTGTFTVTVTGTSVTPSLCNDFTAGSLDGAMDLAMGATAQLDCYGSMTLPATNLTWTGSYDGSSYSTLRFAATTTGKTITTNGVDLFSTVVQLNGLGGAWTLGSAISTTSFRVFAGTFNTSNYTMSGNNSFVSTGTSVRTINLGSSTLTSNSSIPISFSGSNLTFNAGTSQITCSNTAPTFAGGGLTFYDVSFTTTANTVISITGANTYNNLSFTSVTTGMKRISADSNQIINGTLTLGTANTGVRRMQLFSSASGGNRTFTTNAIATLSDVDFFYITAAGAAGTWSGTRLGDGGGNVNITFGAGVTKYWNLAAGGNWSATAWALTSGGAVSVDNFPLAQDTVIIENTGLNTSATITVDNNWWFGNINASTRTNAYTIAWGSSDPWSMGDFTLSSAATITVGTTPNLLIRGTSKTQSFTTAGVTIPVTFSVQAPLSTVRLIDNMNNTAASFGLSLGTLDLNNNTLTCVIFAASASTTRAIAFGTSGKIILTGNNATIWSLGTTTNFSVTGTTNVEANYSGSTGTRTFANGINAQPINFNITAGTDTFGTSATLYANNINFTGFSGTYTAASSQYFTGNFTLSTGMTIGALNTIVFNGTSGIQLITFNGKTVDTPIFQDGVGGTVQLQDNLTLGSTRTFTLTNGSLNLNNQTLSTGLFSSSNSNTRAIAFGTGKIVVTGDNATVWNTTTATNFSFTGTSRIEANYSGSTGTRTFSINNNTLGGTEANALNFYITAGTDSLNFGASNQLARTLDLTGFAGTLSSSNKLLCGNLVISSGTTVASGTGITQFSATSGTQQITSNGVTFDQIITVNAPGATVQLQDNLTMGSTRTLTLTAGTLDVNSKTLTCGVFSSSNSNTRTVAMGTNGKITVNGGNWTATTSTGLSLTGTGTIDMTSASAKTFAGGGATYPYTLNQGGLGTLDITGNNTFSNLTNTVQPTTIQFTAGGTNTFADFSLLGTVGNLVSLRSLTPGSQYNFVYTGVGEVTSVNYLDIRDSAATPSTLTWYGGFNSVDSGNNTGWLFANVPILASITEPITSDNINTLQANFAQSRVENIVMNDIRTMTANFALSRIENNTMNDVRTTTANFIQAVTENSNLNDIRVFIQGFTAIITENFSANDARVINANFLNSIIENANILDIRTVVNLYNIAVIENIDMFDSAYITGWIRINDGQTASWAIIPAANSAGWTNINDTQTSSWSNIDNSQPRK